MASEAWTARGEEEVVRLLRDEEREDLCDAVDGEVRRVLCLVMGDIEEEEDDDFVEMEADDVIWRLWDLAGKAVRYQRRDYIARWEGVSTVDAVDHMEAVVNNMGAVNNMGVMNNMEVASYMGVMNNMEVVTYMGVMNNMGVVNTMGAVNNMEVVNYMGVVNTGVMSNMEVVNTVGVVNTLEVVNNMEVMNHMMNNMELSYGTEAVGGSHDAMPAEWGGSESFTELLGDMAWDGTSSSVQMMGET
ncbi:hypothetical protein A9Z42_0080290 [Trichoderma parareesei]|uniref:Uncharacterized protein n=1 Tax=Trichoderma parareesei TaxID=858221 RepID=A0A2H2ZVK4_TRIPA|nr:hypothetical protein A9Z42_0080290 [Trichoderma parareesei]